LRGIQSILSELEKAGSRPVGISADTPQESADLARNAGLTFPLLSDSKGELIRRYDLLEPGSGLGGRDISDPGEFLVDKAGVVRWQNLGESSPERFLAAAKKLD
jgi:peroxiredoxin Q/BCP